MHEAYVICRFHLDCGIPIFKDAGIYSERILTTTDPHGEVQLRVFKTAGLDYQAALNKAIAACRNVPMFHWLLPHILRQQNASRPG
jgi:hypothetical protein